MIAPVIRPPLRHRATLERNTATGTSPTNQPLAPTFEVVNDDLHCHYWEPERAVDTAHAGLREGPNTVVVALGPRLLVRTDAEVLVGDRVTEVRSRAGIVSAEAMRVVEVLWRSSHTEIGLELTSSGPVVEEGS